MVPASVSISIVGVVTVSTSPTTMGSLGPVGVGVGVGVASGSGLGVGVAFGSGGGVGPGVGVVVAGVLPGVMVGIGVAAIGCGSTISSPALTAGVAIPGCTPRPVAGVSCAVMIAVSFNEPAAAVPDPLSEGLGIPLMLGRPTPAGLGVPAGDSAVGEPKVVPLRVVVPGATEVPTAPPPLVKAPPPLLNDPPGEVRVAVKLPPVGAPVPAEPPVGAAVLPPVVCARAGKDKLIKIKKVAYLISWGSPGTSVPLGAANRVPQKEKH